MSRPAVFVDTWAWVAMAVKRDPAHDRAVALRRAAQRDGALLVTSDLVVAEGLTRLRYDFGRAASLLLAESVSVMVEAAVAELVFVDQDLWQSALAWFRRFDDQRFSFVDCTSFAIMEARGLTDALTADRHFATAGFTPLGAV